MLTAYMDMGLVAAKKLNEEYSVEHYSEKDKDEEGIYYKRKKIYRNYIRNNSHIKKILDVFISIVTVEDSLFNLDPKYDKYICFKNGIFNLNTHEFRCRTIRDRFT